MKKILVPVDFSECSEYALEVASNLAKEYNAEIIALHMLMTDSPAVSTAKEMPEGMYYIKLAEKRFEEFLDKDFLEGITLIDAVYNCKKVEELNAYALDNDVDLIIMGSHGSSGLSEVFVGSNTEKVVRSSDIPVLVVKKGIRNFKIKNAVFACDFTDENLSAFENAMKLFKSLDNAKVKLLFINLPGQNFRSSKEMEARVREFLFKAAALDQLDNVIYYSDYTVEDGIFHYSNKMGVDVIALPTHGRRGLAHFFTSSISEGLVNHSKIPVINFKI